MNTTNESISADAKIINTTIEKNVKIFERATVKNSELSEGSIVGEQAIVLNSRIGLNVSINRRNYILRSIIGKHTYTGIGAMIRSAEVGNFCSISWNVSIGGGDHDYSHVTTSPLWRYHMMEYGSLDHEKNSELQKRFEDQGQCQIGHDVWIATNVVILRNIKIGNGAVIGAGAIVTKDVEPYSIVVGVPGKVVKKRFDDKTIEALEEIQWWNWPRKVINQNIDLIYSTKVDEACLEKLRQISRSL